MVDREDAFPTTWEEFSRWLVPPRPNRSEALPGYNPAAPEIVADVEDLREPGSYERYRRLSEAAGKPLRFTRRPAKQPAGTLLVRKSMVKTHRDYVQLRNQAKAEGKELWFEDEDVT